MFRSPVPGGRAVDLPAGNVLLPPRAGNKTLPAIRDTLPFKVLAAAAVLVTAASTVAAASTPTAAPTPVAVARVTAAPGDSTVIPGFLIQSSAQTGDTGATISTPGYNTA